MLERIHGEQLLRAFAARSDEPAWILTWQAVSVLGSPAFFTTVTPLLYAFAARSRANRFAAWFLTSTLASEILKAAIARPRLDPARFGLATPLEQGGEFESASFPSGHVLTAAVVWGTIGLRVRSPWLRAACWALLPLMAISRMALLRHDLLDVIGGLLVGSVVLLLVLGFERRWLDRLTPLPWVEQAGLWMLCAVALLAAWPMHAVAVAAGVLAGLMAGSAWACDRQWDAARRGPAWRMLGAALGLLAAAGARYAGRRWWSSDDATALVASFVIYAAAGVWIAGWTPALLRHHGGWRG